MIKPFDSGCNYIPNIFSKLISLLVIWSCYCSEITMMKVTQLGTSIVQVFQSALTIIPEWISKPRIKKSFKHRKASNGAGRFAINLRKCKYSDYDVRNCKSSQHNRGHSFKRHSPRHRLCPSNNTYKKLTVEGRKRYTPNSPHRQTRMIRADLSYQDDIIRRSTRFKPPLLHSNKFDMNYNHLSVDSTHTDHSILNCPPQFTSTQVYSTTDLFDEVVLTEVVM